MKLIDMLIFVKKSIIVSQLLLIKILLMPTLIAGVTLAVRKWGEGIGGFIGGFPWVAGPVSFFIALEQGPDFVVASTPSAMMGVIGTYSFALIYTVAAKKVSWFFAMMLGYMAFFMVAFLTLGREVSIYLSIPVCFIVLTGILYIFPKPKGYADFKKQPYYDIPLRMLVATCFVVGVTQALDLLGPKWSGILTPFPIMTSTLAIFTHAQQGSDATSRIMYGLLLTGYGFAFFLGGVAFLVPIMPIGWAYTILTVGAMCINGMMIRLIRN